MLGDRRKAEASRKQTFGGSSSRCPCRYRFTVGAPAARCRRRSPRTNACPVPKNGVRARLIRCGPERLENDCTPPRARNGRQWTHTETRQKYGQEHRGGVRTGEAR